MVTKPRQGSCTEKDDPQGRDIQSGTRQSPGTPQGRNQGRKHPGLTLLPIPLSCQCPHLPNPASSTGQGDLGVGSIRDPEQRGEMGCPWTATPGNRPGAQGPAWTPDPPASCCEVKPTLLSSQGSSCWGKGARSSEEEPQMPSVRKRMRLACLLVLPRYTVPEEGLRAPGEQP